MAQHKFFDQADFGNTPSLPISSVIATSNDYGVTPAWSGSAGWTTNGTGGASSTAINQSVSIAGSITPTSANYDVSITLTTSSKWGVYIGSGGGYFYSLDYGQSRAGQLSCGRSGGTNPVFPPQAFSAPSGSFTVLFTVRWAASTGTLTIGGTFNGQTITPIVDTQSPIQPSGTSTLSIIDYGGSGVLLQSVSLLNALPATATFAGTGTSTQGIPSSNFTVTINEPAPIGGQSVTLASSVGGDTFIPATLTILEGATSGTFTVTASTSGSRTITPTSSGVVISPATLNLLASAAPATKLVVTTQPPASTASGAPFGMVLSAETPGNNVDGGYVSNVILAIGTNPSSGTLSGITTVAAVAGVATFTGLSISNAGSGYTLIGSSGSLTTATTSAFNITTATPSPTPTKCVVTTQPPGSMISGAPFGLVVSVQDASSSVVTSYIANVSVAIGANPGSGTLSGTSTVPAVAGVATFTGLSISNAGTGYTLVGSSGSLTAATTSAFNITPPPPSSSSSVLSIVTGLAPGLSTVGYAVINPDGTSYAAFPGTGVTEQPVGSGNYRAFVTVPLGYSEIRWSVNNTAPFFPDVASTSFALTPGGLDQIAITDPGGVSGHTTFPRILVALYRYFFRKRTMTATQIKTYGDNGTTVNTTQATSDDNTTQTIGTAT